MKRISETHFDQEVLCSPVPTIVHFFAPWCGLCRLVEPLLLQLQKQYSDHLRVVAINADSSLQLASRYRLRMLPTLLLVQNGQVWRRWETFQSRDQLYQQLQLAVQELLATPSVTPLT
ncbi:MAG: thioredoxin domain-containing protein [Gloeomargarita sp. SKYBB_i_bin120]|nr:thioredoxin family protein [Gloeomargarita sp. SKYB120]MDW8178311.1 thioredoxin domain-containing protein [Gloeomargarita sp. SKYBB_i_bin120]